ncbi:MAG: phosphatidylserine decarboxylase [Alphaproteobacteria bacterium]
MIDQIESILKIILVPIHRDGWRFIAFFAAGALILALIATPLGWIGALLTLWCLYFFRDPTRTTPTRSGLVISPADGVIQSIGPALPPRDLMPEGQEMTRISIFMNILDVHVNRIPSDGMIVSRSYRPGSFFNASLDKASEDNERCSVLLRLPNGKDLVFVQIAGLIARRIRNDLNHDQEVKAGQRFGLIRFGSRLDVYLPHGTAPLVCIGQRAVAGETVLADAMSDEPAREGESR